MRRIALLVVVLSCSRPSQPAQSNPTPPPNAQPAPVVKLPEQPIQKAAPEERYSKLTGIALRPAGMVEEMPAADAKLVDDLLVEVKVQCEETERIALRSKVPFRMVDAEAAAFIEDGKGIGWEFRLGKTYSNGRIYSAVWHGQARAVVMLLDPERLGIGICRFKPGAPAKK